LERDLEAKRYSGLAGYFNAIIIDEGQDIPFSFYRVAFNALKDEKRLYWAYDEAQSLASFQAPKPVEIFGTASQGEPLVDLRGKYPGGLPKSPVFSYCYRTPQNLLMVANAVNMGLFRPAGPIQGISTKRGWEKIGYDVVKGEFKEGSEVVLRRNPQFLKHPQDLHPEIQAAGNLLRIERFADEQAELAFIADEIRKDVKERGISPADIIVTPIKGDSEKVYLNKLEQALKEHDVGCFIPGDADEDFRKKGCVTLAGVWRAKGNEAHKVYVTRFHNVTQERRWMKDDSERARRNEAFVALTRSRLWVVLTGLTGETGQSVFDEIEQALQHLPELQFKGFSKDDFPKNSVQYEVEE
jgi:superfamily I DNA and RNA helicase